MFIILPTGLADAPAARFPWVSLIIGVTCTLVFFVEPSNSLRGDMSPRSGEHQRVAQLRGPAAVTLGHHATDDEDDEEYVSPRSEFFHKWGLVPAEGAAQRGWITHLFLHANIAHLAGNMLFFAIVAPSIETLLGSVLFATFFLLGGAGAAALQAMFSSNPAIPLIGASGAIAACMGLFVLRFGRHHVKLWVALFFFFRLFRKTFHVPAWICGGAWFLDQLLDLAAGGASNGGVAVMAHVGGFGLGVGTSFALALLPSRSLLPKPIHDREKLWRKDQELEDAQLALSRHMLSDAERGFQSVLQRRPTSAMAQWGLAQIRFDERRNAEGTKFLDNALQQWLVERDSEAVRAALMQVGNRIELELLRPALVARVGQEMESINRDQALRAYELAAANGVTRAASRLRELQGLPAGEIQPPAPPSFASRPTPRSLAPVSRPPARMQTQLCSLASLNEQGITVETMAEQQMTIDFSQIKRIAVGVVAEFPTLEGTRRNVVVTDLSVSDDSTKRVVRLPSHLLGLPKLFAPGTPPAQAFASWLEHLRQQSQAQLWPDHETLRTSGYPRFATVANFETASVDSALL